MSTKSRFLGMGVVIGLVVGSLVGVGLTQAGRATAATPSAAPNSPSGGVIVGAPGALPAITTGGTTGSAQSGSAIAYPYFGGSPGIAPDNTIVVTGVGQADMASDGSDRATAQKTALAAALADAQAQAYAIAKVTQLAISGVLSVSASVSPSYGIMPMTGSAGSSAPGQPVPPMVPQPAYPQSLSVSVTVAYHVG